MGQKTGSTSDVKNGILRWMEGKKGVYYVLMHGTARTRIVVRGSGSEVSLDLREIDVFGKIRVEGQVGHVKTERWMAVLR